MPRIAKAYIGLIIGSGAAILLLAAGSWTSSSLRQFAIFLGLAAISSTMKVRIPGIEGTMSPNFVFLVLGMAVCSFSEVTAIALAAALVQSLWAAKQPRLVQVAFKRRGSSFKRDPCSAVCLSSIRTQCHQFLGGFGHFRRVHISFAQYGLCLRGHRAR